jgi:hypothetical protein
MNHRTKVSTLARNSAGDVAPVEKLLNLVMNFPKIMVIRGSVAPPPIEARQATTLSVQSRRSANEKILYKSSVKSYSRPRVIVKYKVVFETPSLVLLLFLSLCQDAILFCGRVFRDVLHSLFESESGDGQVKGQHSGFDGRRVS